MKKVSLILSGILIISSCNSSRKRELEEENESLKLEVLEYKLSLDSLYHELEETQNELALQRRFTEKQAEIMARDTSSY